MISNKTSVKDALQQRLLSCTATVGVIGMGYVGVPLAMALARAGYSVIGIDISETRVAAITSGDPGTPDVDSAAMQEFLASGSFRVTSQFSAIEECDAVSICVPTPLRKTGDPDISYIVAAIEGLVPHIHEGTVIVLESTTYPGTTSEIVVPLLKRGAPHLVLGEDIFLAFSPERVDPGREDWTTTTTPKVIGGHTPACCEVAVAFYSQAIETLVPVSSTETAEMVKLLENTFRAVNIGLANEVLLMCDKLGLNAWEVIEAAATKPFGFLKFTPGPGLGGHCIPIDPLYLSWKLRTLNYDARFIHLASDINTSMPRYWVQRVQNALNDASKSVKGSRVLVIGVAYKPDVSDVRESPALDIIELLRQKGADVLYHDPHVPSLDVEGTKMDSVDDLHSALRTSDCTVVVTNHASYDWRTVKSLASCLVDTRNATSAGM
jgi:UDP-N-acetyl-D-glucosamine dehydrogenase